MNSFVGSQKKKKNRREFLKNGMVAAGAATLGTGLLASGAPRVSSTGKRKERETSQGETRRF